MTIDLLLGLQWGDEGKGKIVDVLTSNYDIIARFQGGPNAGHTLEFDGIKHVLRTIPSGIFHKTAVNIIGNGVVIDPVVFQKEIEGLEKFNIDIKSKLIISRKAHLILPTHRLLDAASETAKGKAKIGSTLKGIGPAYMDKTGRNALRVGDLLDKKFISKYIALRMKHQKILDSYNFNEDISEMESEFFEAIEFLKTLNIINCEYFINEQIAKGKKVLAEGAQGSMLDIDFGTFPFVTSSNTIAAGVCNGLGIAPRQIGEVIGVTKAYCTRVGGGPFPTELFDESGEFLRKTGFEFGTTTGRPRRCGWYDAPIARYSARINGVTDFVLTKLDVLTGLKEIPVCVAYDVDGKRFDEMPVSQTDFHHAKPIYEMFPGWTEDISTARTFADLPKNAQDYIVALEKISGARISAIGVGPARDAIIERHSMLG